MHVIILDPITVHCHTGFLVLCSPVHPATSTSTLTVKDPNQQQKGKCHLNDIDDDKGIHQKTV